MNNSLISCIIFLLLSCSSLAIAQEEGEMQINTFIIKETLSQNDQLAILACDSLDKPLQHINGTFQFTINGFTYPLTFNQGVAITPNKIVNSTFVYLQHKNSSDEHSLLFYVLKKENGLEIYKINWFLLILAPLVLLVMVMLFKRFFWLAVILFCAYLYFNAQKGLDLSNFLEIIIKGIQNLI